MDYNISREIRDEDFSVHCSKNLSLRIQEKYKDKQLHLLSVQCIRADIM